MLRPSCTFVCHTPEVPTHLPRKSNSLQFLQQKISFFHLTPFIINSILFKTTKAIVTEKENVNEYITNTFLKLLIFYILGLQSYTLFITPINFSFILFCSTHRHEMSISNFPLQNPRVYLNCQLLITPPSLFPPTLSSILRLSI